jgi:hypothetical protein
MRIDYAALAKQLAEDLDAGADTPEAARWRKCVALIGSGVYAAQARRQAGFPRRRLRRYLRAEPRLRARYEYARRWGRRRGYSKLAIEEALAEVVNTDTGLKAALARRGFTPVQQNRILCWAQTDPELSIAYQRAKAAQRMRLLVGLKDRAWSEPLRRSGRRAVSQELRKIDNLRPVRIRRANAIAYREAYAQREPLKAALHAARRRSKRAAKTTETNR